MTRSECPWGTSEAGFGALPRKDDRI
jgi:hypothetical protein